MPYAVAAGTFTKVVFETSQLEALITSLDWLGIARANLDADSMDTPPPAPYPVGNSQSIASGLVDPGELVLDIHFNPELDLLIDQPPEVITVIWPPGIGSTVPPTWSVWGFVRHIDINGPMDGRISATLTIKLSMPPPLPVSDLLWKETWEEDGMPPTVPAIRVDLSAYETYEYVETFALVPVHNEPWEN